MFGLHVNCREKCLFKTFACPEAGAVHDCYISLISEIFKDFNVMGPKLHMTEYESDEYLEGDDIL